jgi:D-amino-acid dehydrogenase
MAEVVVIGGGIVGASAAYRLVRRGAQATLVDRSDVGYATAAGAGIVDCPIANDSRSGAELELLFRACEYYRELIPQLADDGCTDTGYEIVGALMLATDEAERERLAQEFDGHLATGELVRLEAPEPKRRFPLLRDDIEAVHLSGRARVDGRRLRDSLLRAFGKRGGKVIKGAARLLTDAGQVKGVRVGDESIGAEAVVAAAGAWGDALGVRLGVYPQRGQILHLAVPDLDTSGWPILESYQRHYILTFPKNRVVAGSTWEDDAGYDYRVTAAGQAKLIADALRFAPGLATATIVETRVGFRPKSRDGLPILGPAPGVDGLFVANGLGESGLTMGPYVGALVADLACGESAPFDIEPFSADRASVRAA